MDPRFQTSFIPKKPIVAQVKSGSSSPINLFTLISTVLFFAMIAVSAGAFLYKGLLVKQIGGGKASLDRARDAFDPELISQIVRLDSRINTAKALMASHVTVNPLFDFVSSITLQTVRFKNFNFSYLAPDKIQVSMTGQTRSYASVALQSDTLNEQKSLKNVTIGDMVLDASGSISFDVTAVIDPTVLSYSTSIAPAAADDGSAQTNTQTQ
ncbi:MAG: hypothetical protein WC763_04130 [Candidatus Paceibacterota bacterium]|jgi:hypothetical protein